MASSALTQKVSYHPLVGRTFMHPLADYLLIGGVLSLVVVALVIFAPEQLNNSYFLDPKFFPWIILLCNFAHFAASTVRLYTKPDCYSALPGVTMLLPLVMLIVLIAAMQFSGPLGPNLQALYLTWSPYHYAAQAYGLAVMYCYRSGCILQPNYKRLIWWVAMLPFFYNFLVGRSVGLDWCMNVLSSSTTGIGITALSGVHRQPMMTEILFFAQIMMIVAAIAGTLAMFVLVGRAHKQPMPIISLLAIVSNGFWFFVLPTYQAFVLATVFHGIQYMAIVTIFHVKDQMQRPENSRGRVYHSVFFYGCCLALAYALFYCLPAGFQAVGYDFIESVLLVIAVINIHHFIVDAYIWRLGAKDGNRKIVASKPT